MLTAIASYWYIANDLEKFCSAILILRVANPACRYTDVGYSYARITIATIYAWICLNTHAQFPICG